MNKQRQLDDFFGIDPENEEKNGSHKTGIREFIHRKNLGLKIKFKLLPKVFTKKERYIILFFVLLGAGSILAVPITSYYHFTEPIAAYGGTLKEGIVGEPRHINPLLSQGDADRDIVSLIYSGLLQYNGEGKLVPDLASSYEISQDELNYTVKLKKDIKWHDGENLTADDVIFTVQAAQNSDYGSTQRINWQGVEVEKADDYTIIFKLKNKYAQFLNNLTLPILPYHIWENVKPINFALSEFNLKPIGSGPYKFEKLQKDSSGKISLYQMAVNKSFYSEKPYIDSIQLRFYESEDQLIDAYNKGEVKNLGFVSAKNLDKLKFTQRLTIEKINMPRYFGIFFNQNQSKILSDKNTRVALSMATNKNALNDKILNGNGIIVDSPIIEEIFKVGGEVVRYENSITEAEKLLEKSGWLKTEDDPIRGKEEEKLVLKLTTSTWPELVEVAQTIKEQWLQAGIDVQIETLPTASLQQAIRDRNYEMLLFGEILTLDPDPFSLWHSSQKKDPGLNLALYDNKDVDILLEDARKTLNPEERFRKYGELQKLITEDVPAIFLYSPYYLYPHAKEIKGFNNKVISTPPDRLNGIEKWYIETQRVKKAQ